MTNVSNLPSHDTWSYCPFGDLYTEPSRNGIYKSAEFQGRGTKIVNMGEIFGIEFISNQEMSRVELTLRELSNSDLIDGDLLFGRRSVVPSGAGKCSIVLSPEEPLTFESSIIRARLKKDTFDPLFYYYFFSSPCGRKIVSSIISGTNVKGIRSSELKELIVPIPSAEEQRAIATALSDMDALISGLDQLIAKKRDIKQATMQQLLTGQTRLPGFSGEWEVRRLGECGELISGGTPKTTNPEYWGGDIKWCTPTDITGTKGKYLSETERKISGTGLANSGARLLPPRTLLICTRATIGEVKISTVPVCTNQGFKSLVCGTGINYEFMYYKLLTMKQDMVERAFGSTFLEISKANMEVIELLMPSAEEQAAIATILSDIDAELATLEARRDKAKQLKQGMMQELLTGRIRLV